MMEDELLVLKEVSVFVDLCLLRSNNFFPF